jgi:hypothetical protein
MLEAELMAPREKQINLRLSDDELARLQEVAAERGLDASNTIRQLLKQEHDRLTLRKQIAAEPFRFEERHSVVMAVVHDDGEKEGKLLDIGDIRQACMSGAVRGGPGDWKIGLLPQTLNELVAHDYLRRLKGRLYQLTEKGKAFESS